MKLPAYPRTKPSGVEWLGDVPEHWETKKVTHGFSLIGSGTTPKSESNEFYDGDIPWVTTSELRETVINKTKESVTQSALAAHSALRLYPSGTLLFAMYGATIGRLGILGIPATLNQACCAFAEPTLFDIKFVYYWLWMRRPILISLSTGGGQPNLSQDDLRQTRISTPPLAEQRSIAVFLDRETGRIDTLVAKKRELIERLKEKRSALISRTVTRGLPAEAAAKAGLPVNPPLKPSGLDWLGEIPEHWETDRLRRRCLRVTDGAHISPDLSSPDFPFVSTVDLANGEIGFADCLQTSQECYEYLVRTGCRPFEGDVLFSKDGTVGRTAIVAKCVPFVVASSLVIISPKQKAFNSGFLNYWLNNSLLQQDILLQLSGAALRRISVEKVSQLPVVVPPLPEQAAIAAYLDEETAKLDALVGTVEEAVERLQEYRTALITAAVTGKIDVRVVANPQHVTSSNITNTPCTYLN